MTYAEEYASRLNRMKLLSSLGISTKTMSRPASKTELANLILQRARSDFKLSGPIGVPETKKEDKNILDRGKSVGLGILDILSRPLYGLAEGLDTAVNEGGNPLKGAWEGISGKEKTSFIDVSQNSKIRKIRGEDEYKRIVSERGEQEGENYIALRTKDIQSGLASDVVPGLVGDLALDPLNFVPAGIVAKPFTGAKSLVNTYRGLTKVEDLGEAALVGARPGATSLAGEAVESLPSQSQNLPPAFIKSEETTLSPSSQRDIDWERLQGTKQPFPKATRAPFTLPKRPDTANIEGVDVPALKGQEQRSLIDTIKSEPKFATLADVFNKDIRPKDYEGLTKARVVNETAQIVDQAAKSNPAAIEFLSTSKVGQLSPVARSSVDDAVDRVSREIKESIADPVKARAAGKQPRHPVFNAPTQTNLSNKLTTAARAQFEIESLNPNTGSKVTKGASNKFIPAVYERYISMLRNAEESMVSKGRDLGDDAFYPRAGNKPDSPYLRLSDVLDRLPPEIARKSILGPVTKDKVLPGLLLRAVAGEKKALGVIARDHKDLAAAISQVDWAPLMTKEYALRVIDAANKVKPALDEAADLIDQAKSLNASDTTKAAATDQVVNEVKKPFKNEMPSAKGSFYDLIKTIANPKPNVVEQIIDSKKSRLAAGVTGGKNGQKVAQPGRIAVAAESIEEATGVIPKEAGLNPELADKAAEYGIFSTVLSWIKPDLGYKELRPTVIKNVSVRKASAATRANQFTKILNLVPTGEHLDFWKEATGVLEVIPEHAEAVQHLQKAFGNMFGESGLLSKFEGNSSIARAGIAVNDLNKHLRIAGIKDFQFTKEAKDPLTGKMIKFDGPEMLQSWRHYIPKSETDLRQFVFGMTQAVENVMVEYSTYANLGALWGSKKFKEGYVKVSDMHPAINEMYFPKDIVSQIGKMSRGIDEFYEPLTTNNFMKLYDQALRSWKSGVTIYAPSHHIRNMIGDMFLAWLDGVSNPVYYERARKVLMANYGHYSDIDPKKNPLSDILGEGREADIIAKIMGQSKKRIPKGEGVIANAKIQGKRYQMTIDQVYQMGFRHGLFPHSNVIEDMPGSETFFEHLAEKFHPGKAGPFQPFGGRVQKAARQVSESREHYARLAHYLYALEHTKANSLEDLFELSAQRVRKYHPDGLDLTTTEKHVLRRLFPFYAWTRKAIPLVVEGVVTHPAKIMAYPKIMSAMQEQGGQDSSVSDPWPEDQLFPDWLSGNVIGPVFDPQSALSRAVARSDDEVGYTIFNPGNPATDILEDYTNNPIKGIGNSVTPFLKIPAELGFGTEFMSGAPITDKTEYVDKNIPLLSTISRMTNGAVGSGLIEGGDLKGKESEPFNPQALINYLTGAGILDTGRYTKGGEFDLKKRIAEEKKRQEGR